MPRHQSRLIRQRAASRAWVPATDLATLRSHNKARLERHFIDAARLCARPDVEGGKLTPTALSETIDHASAFDHADDGHIVCIRAAKDVLKAEFDVDRTGSTFYGPLTGHGPRVHRDTLNLVRGASATQGRQFFNI